MYIYICVCVCVCVCVLVCGIGYILMFAINTYKYLFSNTSFFYKRKSKWRGVGGVVGDGD